MLILETIAVDSTTVAFASGSVFGFVNSLHCVGMCGPLVASAHGGLQSGIGYHGARVAAYTTVGLVSGAIGGAIQVDSVHLGGSAFAFVLAAVMVLMAFGVAIDVATFPWAGRFLRRVCHAGSRVAGRHPRGRARPRDAVVAMRLALRRGRRCGSPPARRSTAPQ